MTRFLIHCLCLLLLGVSQGCVSPSLLGASALRCSDEDLAELEALPALTSAELAQQHTGDASALKVAVFNIRSGFGPDNDRRPAQVQARLEQIAAALLAAGAPDVIGLNEVDFHSRRTGFVDQAELIARQLKRAGFHYRVVRGPAWLRDEEGREIRYGNAVLVRHPIVRARHCSFARLAECDASPTVENLPQANLSAPWSWLSHEPRGVVMADFRWRGHTVRAIVTHLDPFSAQVRETQAAQIIAGLVPSDGPVVLLGDMNTVPMRLTLDRTWFRADRTHDVLTSGRLLDARSELAGNHASHWQRWATYPADDPRWPLDGLFVSADLRSVELEVVGAGLSDHLGLVGTLVPVTDASLLNARLQSLAQRRQMRFTRLERCDFPDGRKQSFFAWLRDVTAGSAKVDTALSVAAGQTQ